jgi:probable HAF family extracellular repeat protein
MHQQLWSVVGYSGSQVSSTGERAFLYSGGQMTDLNNLIRFRFLAGL